MRLTTRVVVATTCVCVFSAARPAFAQFSELTSRVTVAGAMSTATTQFPPSTATNPTGAAFDTIDSRRGVLFRYGLQTDLTETLGAEIGIQDLRVPVTWRPATGSAIADHLNIPMLTLGVNAHRTVGRWELSAGPLVVASARNTVTFAAPNAVTTISVSDTWTWGLHGSVSFTPSESSSWAVGLYVGFTDLHLRLTGSTTSELGLTPVALGVTLSYRH